jgi:hypothetical protein
MIGKIYFVRGEALDVGEALEPRLCLNQDLQDERIDSINLFGA